ncbi:MAG: YbgC/FadM family acyl-CoA thioesterase [Nitrospirota bacterium]
MAHTYKAKVYYEDTDAGGVVYYGKYLGFLERARTEFLLEKGISVADYHHQGLFLVVTRVDISYKKPARLGDIIEITTEITEIKNASMTLKNQVLRDGVLLVEAYVTFACIDKDGRPKRLPEALRTLAGPVG